MKPSPDFSRTQLTWIHLPSESRLPKYQLVYQAICQAILQGLLHRGERLPATRILAQTLGVSRNTVCQAYSQLVTEGYVASVGGGGHFIAKDLPDTLQTSDATPPISHAAVPPHGLSERAILAASLTGKPSSKPQPFMPGVPDFGELPLDLLARLMGKHLRQAKPANLAYSDPAGYGPFRKAIADYLKQCRGVLCQPDQVFITAGAQQGLDLIADVFLNPTDLVWMEDPGYQGAKNVFRAHGAHLQAKSLDSEGLELSRETHERPKLIYVTPSHQYPSGVTMSLVRRLNLLNLAQETGAWIVEDDYDSEFRFQGKPLPALQGLDPAARVIYVGTLSKVLFPSMRIGYLVIPKTLISTFKAIRAFHDSFPPVLIQSALAEFIEQGHFASHLRRMRVLYQERQACLINALQTHASTWLSLEPSPAGMHLVALAKQPMDDVALSEFASTAGLVLRPLSTFFLTEPKQSGFVLGFSGFSKASLVQGTLLLAKLLRDFAPTTGNQEED